MITEKEFLKGLQKLLVAYPPKDTETSAKILGALLTSAGAILSWQAAKHIEDHDGYDCVEEMLSTCGQLFESRARDAMDNYLECFKLAPMPTSDVNRKTRESILAILKKEHDS